MAGASLCSSGQNTRKGSFNTLNYSELRLARFLAKHRISSSDLNRFVLTLAPLFVISIVTQADMLPGAGFIYPLTLVLTNLLIAIYLWRNALKHTGLSRRGWICFALMASLLLVATTLWVFVYPNGAMRDEIGFPEVVYLLAGGLAWLGVIFLRRSGSRNRFRDIPTLLDVLAMGLSGFVFVWYLLIAPYATSLFTDGRILSVVELTPLLNLVLFTLAATVLLQRDSRQPSHLFAFSILLLTAADVSLALVIKNAIPLNVYSTGAFTFALALMAVDAGRTALPPERRRVDYLGAARPDRVPALRLLPYLAAVSALIFVLFQVGAPEAKPASKQVMYWLTTGIFLLLISRQMLTLLDNQKLARSLIAANRELAHAAAHDPLTGLLNRRSFTEQLERVLGTAQKTGTPLALFFIDLDDFKEFNDTYGHLLGDELLVKIAVRLRSALAPDHFAARLGGDEFVVALPGVNSAEGKLLAASLSAELSEPTWVRQQHHLVRASIGVSAFPNDGQDSHSLFQSADSAMYRHKRASKSARLNN